MAVKKLITDKFEEYFQRADADGDGRISGKEAVDFFQGSDLSRPILAQLFRSGSSVGNGTSSLDSRSGKQESKSLSPTENCFPLESGNLVSPSPSADATLTSLADRSTAVQDQQSPSTETKENRIYSAQSRHPWPRMMTRSGVQKYSKVFEQVDTDRDGKITAQQARNLFFRLKLPQEVLEIVWGLPDQENDNMLTLREFCIALYLIESSVPVVPPSGQPAAAYGQEKAEITVLEKHHSGQLDTVEQDSLNNKFQKADKKILKYADVIRAGFLGRREFGNGEFLNKDSDQLSQYFDFDAASEREQFWDMDNISQYFDFDAASEREQFWEMNNISHMSSRSTTESLVGDVYRIREEDDFNARLATLANKVEAIELWKLNGIASTPTHMPKVNKSCSICENMEHSTNLCPMIPIFKEVLRDREANATNTFKKPYQNPYSEEAYNFVPYNSAPKRSLEDTLQRFMESQTMINNQTSEAINDIRRTLTKLTASSSNQGKGG
ncbi:hypothetical protein MIMGU_mgv1a005132mg [Erythranthe guttata]|uniref:EF-hand domain-containing protein n=2 Tax=Erythranthe guttata TaxID=4155 RepID=A0A022QWC6_ERYGU|nr:hypothetical protein MIMGU_mgv1a005132mg [Erythranthe guttata]